MNQMQKDTLKVINIPTRVLEKNFNGTVVLASRTYTHNIEGDYTAFGVNKRGGITTNIPKYFTNPSYLESVYDDLEVVTI